MEIKAADATWHNVDAFNSVYGVLKYSATGARCEDDQLSDNKLLDLLPGLQALQLIQRSGKKWHAMIKPGAAKRIAIP